MAFPGVVPGSPRQCSFPLHPISAALPEISGRRTQHASPSWRSFPVNVGAFLSYIFATTYTPGPNNIMAMRNGNLLGFRGALPFLSGIGAGFFLIMLAASFFNLFLSRTVTSFLPAMRWAGALYMLYLAFLILTAGKKKRTGKEAGPESTSFASGMLLQFVNIKLHLYALTVTGNFVIPAAKTWAGLVGFAGFLAAAGFVSSSVWALFGAFLSTWMGEHRLLFNSCMAFLLLYSAASILGLA